MVADEVRLTTVGSFLVSVSVSVSHGRFAAEVLGSFAALDSMLADMRGRKWWRGEEVHGAKAEESDSEKELLRRYNSRAMTHTRCTCDDVDKILCFR
jgi:hypothetical protein